MTVHPSDTVLIQSKPAWKSREVWFAIFIAFLPLIEDLHGWLRSVIESDVMLVVIGAVFATVRIFLTRRPATLTVEPKPVVVSVEN